MRFDDQSMTGAMVAQIESPGTQSCYPPRPRRTMRIALLNQFYPPDAAPTGVYLHDLGCELVRRGHQVVAIASRATYDGTALPPQAQLDGVEVIRLAGFAF